MSTAPSMHSKQASSRTRPLQAKLGMHAKQLACMATSARRKEGLHGVFKGLRRNGHQLIIGLLPDQPAAA
jgi:hypothetical protein